MNAWLTTKKRGRDDDLIEQDKKKAEDERRRKKGLQPKKQRTKNPKKKASRSSSVLESFVVGDDEEDEAEWSDESSAEEEETKAVTEMSSDSDISDTFMGGGTKRTSKPSLGIVARSQNKFIARKKASVVNLADESSSEEELEISPPSKPRAKTFSQRPPIGSKPISKPLQVDSSSDDDNILLDTESKHFRKKPKVAASVLLDTPPPAALKQLKKQPATKRVTELLDSSDDDEPLTKPKKLVKKKAAKIKTKKKKAMGLNDYCSDEDEAIAIAAAMEESRKMMENEPAEEEIIELQDDDSSVGEDFLDEEAKAATSVLDTANKLSALILFTMAKWSNSAVEGMIVDGAISLAEAKGRDHTWISQETLKDIVPSDIKLADYQLIGVNWMALLHGMKCEVEGNQKHANVNGILADEMGLGKTCQAITFLNWLKHNQKSGETVLPHLIVAPASVLANWFNEFARFAPGLKVIKFHGNAAEREQRQDQIRDMLRSGSLDIVLVSLTCFQKEKSEDRAFLRKIDFDYLVVDEAHGLSNAKSIRYKSMDKMRTLHRLLLTGTPVQNSPKELMSLLCFLMPLFSRKGSNIDEDSGQDGGEGMLQHFVSMQKGDDDHSAYAKLKQLFSPFVLRRRKADVLGQILPPKERKVEFVSMSAPARKIYDSVLAEHLDKKKRGQRSHDHIFTQLRKAANHPLLLRSRYTTASEKTHLTETFYKFGAFRGDGLTREKVHQELEKYNDFEIHLAALQLVEENSCREKEVGRYLLSEDDLFGAEKCVKLREMLPRLIADGHRILLFSVWTTILDILGCLMEQLNIEFRRMDGSTPVGERQNMIDEFNEDRSIQVFLLSTKACGLGINLTSADTCVVYDLDFNPFNDLQAEDRCHRIGQKKPVTIIKLVTTDSVDESIYNMQQRKAKMNAAIMGSTAEWKKGAEKEKKLVMEEAVQRYLKSPEAPRRNVTKENNENDAASDEESL